MNRETAPPVARTSSWLAAEVEALRGAFSEALERLRIARRARSLGELLRDQWDLLPCTAARLRSNFLRRRDVVLGRVSTD